MGPSPLSDMIYKHFLSLYKLYFNFLHGVLSHTIFLVFYEVQFVFFFFFFDCMSFWCHIQKDSLEDFLPYV